MGPLGLARAQTRPPGLSRPLPPITACTLRCQCRSSGWSLPVRGPPTVCTMEWPWAPYCSPGAPVLGPPYLSCGPRGASLPGAPIEGGGPYWGPPALPCSAGPPHSGGLATQLLSTCGGPRRQVALPSALLQSEEQHCEVRGPQHHLMGTWQYLQIGEHLLSQLGPAALQGNISAPKISCGKISPDQFYSRAQCFLGSV